MKKSTELMQSPLKKVIADVSRDVNKAKMSETICCH